VTIGQDEVFVDDAADEAEFAPGEDLAAFLSDYQRNGPNQERQAFEERILVLGKDARTNGASIYEYIADAVDGTGGFSNGAYIFPHYLEEQDGVATEKLLQRRAQADYDNFAGHICYAPWDIINAAVDMIQRKATGEAEQPLSEYWRSVDGRGTSMIDFLEYPHKESRKYGTCIIVTDRPKMTPPVPGQPISEAQNRLPENRPKSYPVPIENVVHWAYDEETNELAAIAILDPAFVDDGESRKSRIRLRLWTRTEWALYEHEDPESASDTHVGPWNLLDGGVNTLEEVPITAIWNDAPPPGKLLGKSEMLEVARLSQTVYNMDSEARDTERKASMFLAISVAKEDEEPSEPVPIGLEVGMGYTGSVAPQWVSPKYDILDKLESHKERKIGSAYQMAGLGAIAAFTGVIQTSSGFHAEVEFAKTERRIARHASQLEAVEKQLARKVLKYFGIDSEATPDLFSVTYPKDYGIRDLDSLSNRTQADLDKNLGPLFNTEVLGVYFKALFPRKPQKGGGTVVCIDEMVSQAVQRIEDAIKQNAAAAVKVADLAKAAMQAKPVPVSSRRSADYAAADGGGENPAVS
jgi:hypothetical protein